MSEKWDLTPDSVKHLESAIFIQAYKDYKEAVNVINSIKHGTAPVHGNGWVTPGCKYLGAIARAEEVQNFANSPWGVYISPFGEDDTFTSSLQKLDEELGWRQGITRDAVSVDIRVNRLIRKKLKKVLSKPAEVEKALRKIVKLFKKPSYIKKKVFLDVDNLAAHGCAYLTQEGFQMLADELETSVEYLITGWNPPEAEVKRAEAKRKARIRAHKDAVKNRREKSFEFMKAERLEEARSKPNAEVRESMLRNAVSQRSLAKYWNIFATRVCREMREELPEHKKKEYLEAIEVIKERRKNGEQDI